MSVRALVKKISPRFFWVAARRAAVLFLRLKILAQINLEIRGRNPRSAAILRKSARANFKAAFADLDHWQDPVLCADAELLVPKIGKFDARADTDDLFHVLPSREKAIVKELKAKLKEGTIFVDLGANIGFFSILGSRLVGHSGRVIAIEMLPETFARLKRHIKLNRAGNISALQCAVSDSEHQVTATVPQGKFGQASISRNPRDGATCQIIVRTRPLDDLLAEFEGKIELIKMDLEGAEVSALRGGSQTLARTSAVIFETLGEATEEFKILADAGFSIRRLDAQNCLAFR